MADDDFPTEYDTIVLGTGMTECIIAAALSRIGQKVLHIDREDYYSGDWATFNLDGLNKWIECHQNGGKDTELHVKPVDAASLLQDGDSIVPLAVKSNTVTHVVHQVYVSEEDEKELVAEELAGTNLDDKCETSSDRKQEKDDETMQQDDAVSEAVTDAESPGQVEDQTFSNAEEDTEITPPAQASSDSQASPHPKPSISPQAETKTKKWTLQSMKKEWRKFNIDLQPRVLYCRGPMVELLISSDIAKYCEFRTITRVLTLLEGKLQQVPCSRSDVFSSKQVSMIEKRMLMKLLTFALEYDKYPEQYAGWEEKPYREFLKSQKLSANVLHYVFHAIAMATESTTTIEGLKSTQQFLQSLGRYGNTAFLWPLYGSGELPQCFCRMCAVFGGIYCLRTAGVSLILDKEKRCSGIIDSEGRKLKANCVILESSYASSELLQEKKGQTISRAVLFTNRSILSDETQDHITLLSLPPAEGQNSVITLFELSHVSMACPKDIYVVHLSCRGVKDAKQDLQATINNLFQMGAEASEGDERPHILWSLFFNQEDFSGVDLTLPKLQNVFLTAGPNLALDFDASISKARELFDRLCPDEDFLPKAPNPEDIIFGDDTQEGTGSGFEPEMQDGHSENNPTGEEGGKAGESSTGNTVDSETDDASKIKSGENVITKTELSDGQRGDQSKDAKREHYLGDAVKEATEES